MTKEALLDFVDADFDNGILITMGAGDIDRLVGTITAKVNSKVE